MLACHQAIIRADDGSFLLYIWEQISVNHIENTKTSVQLNTLEDASPNWRPVCVGLNVLTQLFMVRCMPTSGIWNEYCCIAQQFIYWVLFDCAPGCALDCASGYVLGCAHGSAQAWANVCAQGCAPDCASDDCAPDWVSSLGLYSQRRRRLTGIGIPIINLRRSDDRLRFIMGIPILIRRRLLTG